MKPFSIIGIAIFTITAVLVGDSQGLAQIPVGGPGVPAPNNPVFSPWLNLNRQGTSSAVNLYGLVLPQMEFTNALTNVGQQISYDSRRINDIQAGAMVTGHQATFMSYRQYFLTTGASGSGYGATTGGPAATGIGASLGGTNNLFGTTGTLFGNAFGTQIGNLRGPVGGVGGGHGGTGSTYR